MYVSGKNAVELVEGILLNENNRSAYDKGFKRMIFNEYFEHKTFYKERPF